MGRIFHVRLNLDEMSAHMNTFATDAERGEWVRGFMAGAAGGILRFVDGTPGALGHSLGVSSLVFARQFAAKQSEKGVKSAEARKVNHGSTTVQPRLDNGSTTDEPSLNLSNNRIIEEENKPKNNKRIPRSPAASGVSDSDLFDQFWNAYGKKVGKVKAIAEWNRLTMDDHIAAVEIPTSLLAKEFQFRPDPERYFKYRRWEDEAPAARGPDSVDDMEHTDHIPTAEQIAELTGP